MVSAATTAVRVDAGRCLDNTTVNGRISNGAVITDITRPYTETRLRFSTCSRGEGSGVAVSHDGYISAVVDL